MPGVYAYPKRVAIAAFVTLLVLAGFYLLGRHLYFFLLVFSAILLAVLFCGMTDWFVDKLHLKRGLGLLLAVLLFFGIIVGAVLFTAPTVSQQVQEMKQTLPQAINQVEAWVAQQG